MIKVQVSLGIGISNAYHEDVLEISEDELEGLNDEEIETHIQDYVNTWANNYIQLDYFIVD
jgi:hypothetical protein